MKENDLRCVMNQYIMLAFCNAIVLEFLYLFRKLQTCYINKQSQVTKNCFKVLYEVARQFSQLFQKNTIYHAKL